MKLTCRRLTMIIAASIATLALSAPSLAQSPNDYVVIQTVINPVMQPKSVVDAISECASDTICSTLVDAAASYFGVPPGTVTAAMAAVPSVDRAGEEGRYRIELPPGYAYCRTHIQTVSVVPATGDRASVMGAVSDATGVGIYTWTPRRGLGGGRSWVEANFTVLGVRSDLADRARSSGTCRNPGGTIISCRGASGVNKGSPACGTVSD